MLDPRKPVQAERALLVGLYGGSDVEEPDLSLDELASLVEAAGATVVGRTYQRRRSPRREGDNGAAAAISPATFIGRGKAEQVASLAGDREADVVVFDNELSPAQIRELEKLIGKKVIDRSELILDIFASRARTREARLQVELAQLEYTAPRLRGMWTHLERQAGTGGSTVGLGMKGPGEKQIEIDRRIVRKRLARLRGELDRIHGRKEREVKARVSRVFTVGLVGYTNAGKSTLMNALTGAGAYAADQLFATLDTRTRRWPLEPGADVALSDTVGFVRHLPHHLVASFRATLEEALNAELLLHVIDASHPQAVDQIAAVEGVLADLGCDLSRVLPVLNKVDRIPEGDDAVAVLRARLPGAVAISARTGLGLGDLSAAVAGRRRAAWATIELEAPAAAGEVHALVSAQGRVLEERYDGDRWCAIAELPRAALPALERTSSIKLSVLGG
jgi:GTP-binding protein HflX